MRLNLATWGNALHSGEKTYPIVSRRRAWFAVSALLMALAVGLVLVNKVNPGIEFSGGTEVKVTGIESPDLTIAEGVVAEFVDEVPQVVQLGTDGVRVRLGDHGAEVANQLASAMADAYGVDGDKVDSQLVGPAWGSDVTSKAIKGLTIFLVLVTIVLSAYFRAWRMAAAALIALVHDLVFTIGVYAGVGFEVTPASVIGFLTILGFSLYDTVVVFDKVRENTHEFTSQHRYTYAELANLAVNQTLVRSINTSVVALLPVSAILFIGSFILGAGTLEDISLALFVGLAVGTYSSIFVATPFEVALRSTEAKVKQHTAEVLKARENAGLAPDAVGAPARVGALKPGEHRGTAAQPKRKRRS